MAKRCTLQLKKETRNSRAQWLREQSCASLFATLWYQQKGKASALTENTFVDYHSSYCDRSDDRLFSPLRESFTCSWESFAIELCSIFDCFRLDSSSLVFCATTSRISIFKAPHRPRKCLFHQRVCFHTFFSKSHRNNSEWFKVRALTSDVRRTGARLFNHNWQVFCYAKRRSLKVDISFPRSSLTSLADPPVMRWVYFDRRRNVAHVVVASNHRLSNGPTSPLTYFAELCIKFNRKRHTKCIIHKVERLSA